MPQHDLNNAPHIVVLGAGFAGLTFCRKFGGDAKITVIDRQNHHLFQPLLYQVAMAGLAAPDISEPLRTVFRDERNIYVVMDTVRSIDLPARRVRLCDRDVAYDYLVVALGAKTSYFGNDGAWAPHAPGLKSLDDAMRVRHQILGSYERAETAEDDDERRRLMTIVVVGGGPTGVELSGSMAELARQVFTKDFRRIRPAESRIVLVQGGGCLLPGYPPNLSASAKAQLESLGVEVMLGTRVVGVDGGGVDLSTGERIETPNILWAAGIKPSPVLETMAGVERVYGRVKVRPDLSVPGHPEVFVLGDCAAVEQEDGRPVPGVAPAAMQMGEHAARVIERELRRRDGPSGTDHREAFRYHDKGMMATIGRKRAVAWVGKWQPTGLVAWLMWLFVHIAFLIGFRNRLAVMSAWVYSYVTFRRGARIIWGERCEREDEPIDDTTPPPPRHTEEAEEPEPAAVA